MIAGDRRPDAGRGDRDRRGGLHLAGRDPLGARRRRGRCPAGPDRAALRRLPHLGTLDRGRGRGGGGGERAGLDDRVRHRHRRGGHPWPLQRVPVDRLSLQQLAEKTEGYFYEAASVSELKQVYQDMGSSIGHRTEPREITQWYAGVALLLALRRRR